MKKSLEISETQIETLSKINSLQFLPVCMALFEKYSTTAWPIFEILRVAILEPGARRTINSQQLCQLVKLLAPVASDDNSMVVLFRVISNMFQNYIDEAENDIELLDILSSNVPKFATMPERTQIAFVTVALNFSIYISKSKDLKASETLARLLLMIISQKVDEESLYRVLFTMGNIASSSNAGKVLLREGYDMIVAADTQSDKIHPVIVALSDLLIAN